MLKQQREVKERWPASRTSLTKWDFGPKKKVPPKDGDGVVGHKVNVVVPVRNEDSSHLLWVVLAVVVVAVNESQGQNQE